MCCLNCSSASANTSERPKALRHQYHHQLCHLMQRTTLPQHLFPWTASRPVPCSSSAWLAGAHRHHPAASPSPSTDHGEHYLTTDLLQHSSSPAKAGLDHSARDTRPFPSFQTSLKLEQATLLQYAHLAHFSEDEILIKMKNQDLGSYRRSRSYFLSLSLHFFPFSQFKTCRTGTSWNNILPVESVLKQAGFQ